MDTEATPELIVDGDLLKELIIGACPEWIADHACNQLAERVLVGCARSGYMTVLRGPDSTVWTPDVG